MIHARYTLIDCFVSKPALRMFCTTRFGLFMNLKSKLCETVVYTCFTNNGAQKCHGFTYYLTAPSTRQRTIIGTRKSGKSVAKCLVDEPGKIGKSSNARTPLTEPLSQVIYVLQSSLGRIPWSAIY